MLCISSQLSTLVDPSLSEPSGYLTVCHGIDGPFIDGVPIKNGGSFHGYVSHNQMVYDVTFLNYSWNTGQLSPGKPPPGRCRPTLSRFKMYVFTLFVNSCFQNVLLPCMFHSCLPKIVQIWQKISSLPESDTTHGINPIVDHVFKGLPWEGIAGYSALDSRGALRTGHCWW